MMHRLECGPEASVQSSNAHTPIPVTAHSGKGSGTWASSTWSGIVPLPDPVGRR